MGSSDESGLRANILDASLELGSKLGADGLTMRAIARRLGVSATALYQHFENKGAILQAIRLRGLKQLNEYLRPAFLLDNPVDRLTEQACRYITFGRENPWLYCLLLVEDHPGWTNLPTDEVEEVVQSTSLVRQAMVDGVQRGLLRPGLSPDEAATMLWAALHGLVMLILRGRFSEEHPQFPVENLDRLTRRFVDSLIRGLEVPRA